ncbi:hypothetical protein [Xylanimonas sp. McL0601]|uniref:hypothetical protein n=1 Tax=Xylanimonas sp. McL0601 TaxID=3414739 RepID=UPI003CF9F788
MDSIAFYAVHQTEQEQLERHLAQVRLGRALREERARLAASVDAPGPAPHPASSPRRRLTDYFHTPRRPVRLA